MKKKYNYVDIAKFIFAIGIVAIHASVFDNTNNTIIYVIYKSILRLGVPFFFCCSGYFLGIKINMSQNINLTVKKYIKRLAIPLIFWIIIDFLPLKLIPIIMQKQQIKIAIIKIFRELIFYPWGAMWYLYALIIATLIIIPFYKKGKIINIAAIGGILYIFALLCNNYYFLVEGTNLQKIIDLYLKIAVSARNGIFEGIFFVSTGMYISTLEMKNKINHKLNNIVCIISYIILIVEVLIIRGQTTKDDGSLYAAFILLVPCLLIFLMQFHMKRDTTIIRNYSSGIYFMHRFILGWLSIILTIININISPIYTFIIVIVIVLGLLALLYKINNKNINMVIK